MESFEIESTDKMGSNLLTTTPRRTEIEEGDPIDLETEFFDVNAYVSKMLRECSLVELIAKDNSLIEEIKDLDSDMKTLVYENYSKFISATDTINKMKLKVDDMEKEVDQLSRQMSTILSRSSKIQSNLGGKGKELQELSDAHNILTKFNLILEMPKRLDACWKQGNYQEAVYHYSKTVKVLSHYGHLDIFKGIVNDNQTSINKIVSKLRDKLNKDNFPLKDVIHTVGLLVGADGAKGLIYAKLFFEKATRLLNLAFEDFKKKSISSILKMDASSNASMPETLSVALDEKIIFAKVVVTALIQPAALFAEASATYFLSEDKPEHSSLPIGSKSSLIFSSVPFQYSANLKSEEKASIRKDLQSFLGRYIPSILEVLETHFFEKWDKSPVPMSFVTYSDALNVLHSAQSDALNLYCGYQSKVVTMSKRFYEETVTKLFRGIFDVYQAKVMKISEEKANMRVVESEICTWLTQQINTETRDVLMTLDSNHSVYESSLKKVIHAKTLQLLGDFSYFWDCVYEWLSRSSGRNADVSSKKALMFILVLSKVADSLATQVLSPSAEVFTDSFLRVDLANKRLSKSLRLTESQLFGAFPIKLHFTRFTELSTQLLTQFCLGASAICIHDMTQYFSIHLLQVKSKPSSISSPFQNCISHLLQFEQQLKLLYPSDKKKPLSAFPNVSPMDLSSLSAGTKNSYEFDKLFAEKMIYFNSMEKSTFSILELLVKLILKNCIEELKFTPISYAAAQQLEVDIEFWKQTFLHLLDEDKAMNLLMEEIARTIHRRSIDKFEPMDKKILQAIVDKFLAF